AEWLDRLGKSRFRFYKTRNGRRMAPEPLRQLHRSYPLFWRFAAALAVLVAHLAVRLRRCRWFKQQQACTTRRSRAPATILAGILACEPRIREELVWAGIYGAEKDILGDLVHDDANSFSPVPGVTVTVTVTGGDEQTRKWLGDVM